MKNTYFDLVAQTFDFPQDGFSLKSNRLYFNDIDIHDLIQRYGSPLKLTYLPKIGEKIQYARKLFRDAIQRYNYNGKYVYCYCTKSSHFSFILNEVLENGTQLETSSAFDIDKYTGEPLTGRKKTYNLYPLSEKEYDQIETRIEKRDNLRERLVYGNYPELIHLKSREDKSDYLREIVNSYMLKDILAFEKIRNSDKILSLLRLIAFQIGGEVSYQEIGQQLSMSKNTVEKYLDLLSKVYVLHKLNGFSRNLRKEVTKSSKWYFYDNGLRNLIIANLNPIGLRNDIGQLWENYIISERIKFQKYTRMIVNNYFWRTYDQQEIDWIEERGGRLYGYEFKWASKKQAKVPKSWQTTYADAEFEIIHPENYLNWLDKQEWA